VSIEYTVKQNLITRAYDITWVGSRERKANKMDQSIINEFVKVGEDGDFSKIKMLLGKYSANTVNAKDIVSCVPIYVLV